MTGKLRLLTYAFVIVSLSLCALHFIVIAPQSLNHDFDSHTVYIDYIVANYRLPHSGHCRECGHPPLYYVIAAIAQAAASALGWQEPIRGVMLVSFLCFGVYLFFAIRLLRENLVSRLAYVCGLAVLLFWPLGFNMARIVNNDVPVFTAQLIAFTFLLRWWKQMRPRDLAWAIAWCTVAFAVKANGLIIGMTVAAAVTAKWYQTRFDVRQHYTTAVAASVGFALFVGGAIVVSNYQYYRVENAHSEWHQKRMLITPTISNGGVGRIVLSNDPKYVMGFDVVSFIENPFVGGYKPIPEWPYFWNSLLRSSLFDEFLFKDYTLGTLLNITLLALTIYMLASSVAAIASKPVPQTWALIFAALVMQVGALWVFRLLYPYFYHQHFRFIYVAQALFALLLALSIQWHQLHRRRVLAGAGAGCALLFAVFSIAFILRLDLPKW